MYPISKGCRTFSGTEQSFDAEQWLIDTTDLLKAARILNENPGGSGQETAETCGQN